MYLSVPAKLVLINASLVSIASHIMSVYLLPVAISNKLDSIVSHFLWSSGGHKGIHWKSKELIHLPKGLGGLGVRSVHFFNQALLMKQVWRLHSNPQLLISKVYKDRVGFSIKRGLPSSTLPPLSLAFRSLRRMDNTLLSLGAWKVGDGTSLSAINLPWVQGRIPQVKDVIHIGLARSWRVSNFILPSTNAWNSTLVWQSFITEDARDILATELPFVPSSDTWYWPFTNSGRVTVKSCYSVLAERNYLKLRGSLASTDLWKKIWHLILPIK